MKTFRPYLNPTSDGREAMDNVARAFWQSRLCREGVAPPLPVLTDLRALARNIRSNDDGYHLQIPERPQEAGTED